MSATAGLLQAALFEALTNDAGITVLVQGRVYDRVPVDSNGKVTARFPYIRIPEAQATDDGADCVDGEEVFLDLHLWSRAVGSIECKAIAAAVKLALHEASLDLGSGAALVELLWRSSRFLSDPDGLTTHGVVTFVALTESV